MDERSIPKLWMPTPRPIPIIGPISGEMSIAPIITAVELTFNPREANRMAKIRIHSFVPVNGISLKTLSITFW